MGTPGSESGLEKRTGGNTGTALQADSTVSAARASLRAAAAGTGLHAVGATAAAWYWA